MRSCALRILDAGDHLHRLGDLLRVLKLAILPRFPCLLDSLDAAPGLGARHPQRDDCRGAFANVLVILVHRRSSVVLERSSSARRRLVAQELVQTGFEGQDLLTSMSSRKPLLPAKNRGLPSSDRPGRTAAASAARSRGHRGRAGSWRGGVVEVGANCANAASSRYCARSVRIPPAGRHRLVWAAPPTRDTEIPALIAGRMPR